MSKPVLRCPAPAAARVSDPLPPSYVLRHSATHRDDDDDDDVRVNTSYVGSADLGRTTPDGGSDSDTREHESATSQSSRTSTTSYKLIRSSGVTRDSGAPRQIFKWGPPFFVIIFIIHAIPHDIRVELKLKLKFIGVCCFNAATKHSMV